jgi:methyl-accepting chemotaxis protein
MKLLTRSIGNRLIAGFCLILSALVASAGISFVANQRTKSDITSQIQAGQQRMALAQSLRENLLRSAIYVRNIGLETEVAAMNAHVKAYVDESKRYDEIFAKLQERALSSDAKALLQAVAAARAKALPLAAEAVAYAKAFNPELSIKTLTEKVGPAQDVWLRSLDAYVQIEEQGYAAAIDETLRRSGAALVMMAVVTAASFVLAVLVAIWLIRSIVRPLANAVAVAQAVARKDLTTDVQVTSGDETGQLLEAMRLMNGSLSEVVSQVRSATTQVADASREIAVGNLDLANRTEMQAAALEETSSNMVRLTEAVEGNARNAKLADSGAGAAAETAARAAATVAEVVATMQNIHADARKIGDIVALIDAIAFQTNILALNAAIEAARAGTQGRGFAVVANEVRNLAHRSSTASKEIRDLIGNSTRRVDAGVALAESSGRQMNEVVSSVQKVSTIIRDINVASGAQAGDINNISTAIHGIDQNTQQNAALVEQAAAAAQSLEGQAAALSASVATFKLTDAGPASAEGDPSPEKHPGAPG